MKTSHTRIISLLFVLLVCQPAWARNIMCWKNQQNIRECGETVPPEYNQQRIEVINERGMLIKVIEARKTPEELAREAAAAEQTKRENERRRQDVILLKTFTRESDLMASRDKQLAAIDSSIGIAMGNLRSLNNSLAKLLKRAANHERSGTTIPAGLESDIAATRLQITDGEQYLRKELAKKQVVHQKFAADLLRYRELRSRK